MSTSATSTPPATPPAVSETPGLTLGNTVRDAPKMPSPAFSPLYQQIKDLILQSLRLGEWKPGEAIPSEVELANRYQVSQGTVRKAIDELSSENLLTRRQGKGTFVATHSEGSVQYRFLKLVPDQGSAFEEGPAQRLVVECKRLRANAEVAKQLALRTGDSVLFVRRVLSFGGTPTILEDLWLPGAAFKTLTAEQMTSYQGPTYAMFEKVFGISMLRAEEKLKAVCAQPDQAELLGVTPLTPLLHVERLAFTYNDAPIELRRCLYRTDTHHYRNDLN